MKKYAFLLTLLIILLLLGLFSCSSGQSSPPFTVPTPFVLNKILESLQFSPTNSLSCPHEDEYRSLPADYFNKHWEEWIAHPPASTGGTMELISVSDGILFGLNTYDVPEQKTITATIRYYYLGTGPEDTTPIPMRFVLLLDEQQVTTRFNEEVQPYFDVTIHPGKDGEVTFDIPPLQPGIHDVNLVGFVNVDQEPNYYSPGTLTLRFTLVAGGVNSLLPRPYRKLEAIEHDANNRVIVLVSLEKDQLLDWNYPNPLLPVPLGKPLDFYIFAGYLDTGFGEYPNLPLAKEQPFALVMLEDFRQGAFSSETPVIYGIVSTTTSYARIPVHFLSSQVSGPHHMVVIRITYPGFPMCLLSINERVYPVNLEFSQVWYNIEP